QRDGLEGGGAIAALIGRGPSPGNDFGPTAIIAHGIAEAESDRAASIRSGGRARSTGRCVCRTLERQVGRRADTGRSNVADRDGLNCAADVAALIGGGPSS